MRLCIPLLFVAILTGGAAAAALTVEARSPAVANGQLVEDIGIETLGGVFTPLLERRRIAVTISVSADGAITLTAKEKAGRAVQLHKRDG